MPLVEPQFVLESFRKELTPYEWQFFTFQSKSHLQLFADTAPELDHASARSDDEISSTSPSTSEDSSDSSVSPRPAKACKTHQVPIMGSAEEAVMGLHRQTWHMMVRTDSPDPSLPSWEDHALKTACGRFLPHNRTKLSMTIQLESGQTFCSHSGCRKGFTSLGSN